MGPGCIKKCDGNVRNSENQTEPLSVLTVRCGREFETVDERLCCPYISEPGHPPALPAGLTRRAPV
jgi:hypothetical protein